MNDERPDVSGRRRRTAAAPARSAATAPGAAAPSVEPGAARHGMAVHALPAELPAELLERAGPAEMDADDLPAR